MNEILLTVNKKKVTVLINQFYSYMRTAQGISPNSTYIEINEAKEALCRAQGMYKVLNSLELLNNMDMISEDIDRIALKVNDIYSDKRRNDYPKWRQPWR